MGRIMFFDLISARANTSAPHNWLETCDYAVDLQEVAAELWIRSVLLRDGSLDNLPDTVHCRKRAGIRNADQAVEKRLLDWTFVCCLGHGNMLTSLVLYLNTYIRRFPGGRGVTIAR